MEATADLVLMVMVWWSIWPLRNPSSGRCLVSVRLLQTSSLSSTAATAAIILQVKLVVRWRHLAIDDIVGAFAALADTGRGSLVDRLLGRALLEPVS